MIRPQRAGQDKADLTLFQQIAGAIANARLRAAVAGQAHSEGRSVVVRGLASIADVELDVIGSNEREKIRAGGNRVFGYLWHKTASYFDLNTTVPWCLCMRGGRRLCGILTRAMLRYAAVDIG